MRAVLTVIGQDKVGIVAGVSATLAELNFNIVDMSQTIMQQNFTMMLMCEMPQNKVDFEQVRARLNELGSRLGVQIRIQREEIFDAMHKI
ncbi:ACT domain-containing protein [Loigolactobacillus zhaoyuanensis]|uniref:UPF0237 protein ACEN34_02935 n=1 Tax=Loigolactobacillus zhaoyuanensis TaxID=2486017 RepID=A0ABW8UCM0_9LACO|nr:ACT domain-containing protein [Loigolactobacillus zhaoyuanensis]